MKRPQIRRRSSFLRRRTRGQAMAELAVLILGMFVLVTGLMYFFPEALNALQIYMDSFFYVLSMPFP